MSDSADISLSQRPFPFLSLPLELRLQIYRICTIVGDRDRSENGSKRSSPIPVRFGCLCNPFLDLKLDAYQEFLHAGLNMDLYLPLLTTCRSIYAEAALVFDNHDQPIPGIITLDKFLRSIGRTRRSHIQRLSFIYHYPWDGAVEVDKLAVFEFTTKCFRLMARECRNLKNLRIYVNEDHLRMYAAFWSIAGGVRFWQHTRQSVVNRASTCFNLSEMVGIRELRRLRGIKHVKFLESPGAKEFRLETRDTLDQFAQEMMKPRKETRSKGKILDHTISSNGPEL